MQREITNHKVNGLNEAIMIVALDSPGFGNANHVYGLTYVLGKPDDADDDRDAKELVINFQNGPILESGINGISNEALLAIVEDRLAGFERGRFACDENAAALRSVREAMTWLKERTERRIARGVEGTHKK